MSEYQKIGIFFVAIFMIMLGIFLFLMSYTYISHIFYFRTFPKRYLYRGVIYALLCFGAGFSEIFSGVLLLFKKISWCLYMSIIPVLILSIPAIILLFIFSISFESIVSVLVFVGGYILAPVFALVVIGIIKMRKYISE